MQKMMESKQFAAEGASITGRNFSSIDFVACLNLNFDEN